MNKLPPIAPSLAELTDAPSSLAEVERSFEEDAEEQGETTPSEIEKLKTARMRSVEYTFAFEWPPKEAQKEFKAAGVPFSVYKGQFTHRIPTLREKSHFGVLTSRLSGGLPWESLDVESQEILRVITRLTKTLDVSANPEGHWSHSLEELRDFRVAAALYAEVIAHENTFLGAF